MHRHYTNWQQNGPTEQGCCLIEIGHRISVELTGSLVNQVADEEVQQAAELIMAAPALAKLLASLEPHLDAIICYASSIDEHEPNAIAADVRGCLGHLRDTGALPASLVATTPNSPAYRADPELLSALRWLRAFWNPGSDHDTQEVQHALAAADAAIAKAQAASA